MNPAGCLDYIRLYNTFVEKSREFSVNAIWDRKSAIMCVEWRVFIKIPKVWAQLTTFAHTARAGWIKYPPRGMISGFAIHSRLGRKPQFAKGPIENNNDKTRYTGDEAG